MSLSLEILKFPDPRLRKKAEEVKEVTEDLSRLADEMLNIMYEEKGVGLSSIQVNQPPRLFVSDTRIMSPDSRYDKSSMGELEAEIEQPLVFFNPKILYREGEVVFSEGCLSFPSYYAEVKRSRLIEVQALDKQGQLFKLKTDGLLAICIQHEMDHLEGKLFIDHLSLIKAQKLREKIRKHGYPEKDKTKIS